MNALLVGVMPPRCWCAMLSYRYFLDSADHVAGTEFIACATDAQAQARADRLLAAWVGVQNCIAPPPYT